MPRRANRFGGGSRTNANGLHFEQTTNLDDALVRAGYSINDCHVFKDGVEIGMSTPKNKIYTYYLLINGIDYRDYNSKRWQPDEAFINFNNGTVYIIEKKFQNGSGSVDEKLPNCDFKKQEYEKLFFPLNYKVVFIYVFNDWFRHPQYRDTLEYIERVGCKYFFNEIPLEALGL